MRRRRADVPRGSLSRSLRHRLTPVLRAPVAWWNVGKVWLVCVGFWALLGAAGWALGGIRDLAIFLVCGILITATGSLVAERLPLALVGGKELPLVAAPAVHTAVERLALRAGVPKPRVHVMPAGLPIAFVAGRGAASAVLVVSSGLLTALPPAELEGVLAHEVAHLRRRDVTPQTSAVVVGSTLLETSRIGILGPLQDLLLWILGPLASAFVHLLLSPSRELAADRLAAELCETPHGLADALLRLEHASELVEFRASPVTSPLYTFDPFERGRLAALFATHPPIGERVARLRALDPDWRSTLGLHGS
jgi:heat shock protein HtpX